MTLDTDTLRPRRAVLAAALGGVAATAVAAIGRPDTATAATGGNVILGSINHCTAPTGVYNDAADQDAFIGLAQGSGVGIRGVGNLGVGVFGISFGTGVRGESTNGTGIYGLSESGIGIVGTGPSAGVSGTSTNGSGVSGSSGSAIGVAAYSNATDRPAGRSWSAGDSTGLQGHSGADSPPAAPAKTGVFGYAVQDAAAIGVRGQSTAGRGVYGQATSGQGVRGYATSGSALYGSTSSPKSGLALRTVGRVRFEQSVGIATISAGSSHVTVTPGIDVNTSSAVVATLQGSAGGKTTVHRVSVSTTADTFTIYLTANATASVKVAWHIFG